VKVLVVCSRRYNGHELWTFLGVLHEGGILAEVISTDTLIMDEITFQPNTIERTLDDVETLDGFDGLAFISGNMKDTEATWRNPRALSYVRQAQERDIPIAAICCSVPIVRHAAEGKKVSFFPLIRSGIMLEEAGAILQTVSITVDGKLVTAEHQMATQLWAESFVKVLNGEKVKLGLKDSGFTPGGTPRKPDPDLQRLRNISARTGKTGTGG
jgi:putative intracellular protease/amidase